MSQPMTTWKEIAAYLGKSVRTVQRWERELAMPVHRSKNKNVLIVSCEDLDGWIKDQETPRARRTEREELRRHINELEAENGRLRTRLNTAILDARCELLRESVISQAARSYELSQTSAKLQARSNSLSIRSRVLRDREEKD